ncbi:MAG: hypothetical protein IJJ99_02930 [Oscillospiraceae bacterium]|nr:hypothetical protein [Oscillospiraceae bacterium]
MNNAQIIPVAQKRDYLYVDEPSEFEHLSRCTDQRKQRDAERIESDLRERNRQRREARREWRHLMHNCYLMFLGIVATCCALASITAIRASYPALAIFPAVLALVSLWAGMVQKNG